MLDHSSQFMTAAQTPAFQEVMQEMLIKGIGGRVCIVWYKECILPRLEIHRFDRSLATLFISSRFIFISSLFLLIIGSIVEWNGPIGEIARGSSTLCSYP